MYMEDCKTMGFGWLQTQPLKTEDGYLLGTTHGLGY